MEDDPSVTDIQNEMMRGIGVGISLGTATGILMDNLPMWIALGVAGGVVLGAGLSRREQARI